MKHVIILFAIFITISSSFALKNKVKLRWKQFKDLHGKSYNSSEEFGRGQIFNANLRTIKKHNRLYKNHEVSYQMGVNRFSDLSSEEFVNLFLNYEHNKTTKLFKQFQHVSNSDIPDAMDWREKGAVTEVKSQGVCGSAWIYSVTGALEGQNFVRTGKLIPLSEQELADCASSDGCQGGFVQEGYDYVIEHGLSSAADYPDSDSPNETCHRGAIPSAVVENGYVSITGNEEALREIVGTIGPVAVFVDASSWQLYAGGILTCLEAVSLNHGVLVVGYGNDNGTGYWLVKNSWGTVWGERGYIRILRNSKGNCGIAVTPSYPIV